MKLEYVLEKYKELMSQRLYNALYGSRHIWKTLEGVDLKQLLNRRNVGKGTFFEFLELKEDVYNLERIKATN